MKYHGFNHGPLLKYHGQPWSMYIHHGPVFITMVNHGLFITYHGPPLNYHGQPWSFFNIPRSTLKLAWFFHTYHVQPWSVCNISWSNMFTNMSYTMVDHKLQDGQLWHNVPLLAGQVASPSCAPAFVPQFYNYQSQRPITSCNSIHLFQPNHLCNDNIQEN